jgi:cation:H+ antiporter
MFTNLALPLLIGIFILSAFLVWFAGMTLAKSTNALSERFNLGKALGGMILLAIVTDLPEVAITVGGALGRNFSLVTGNLLGGVAMQTAVLVILDQFGDKGEFPLTSRLKNLIPLLEGLMVIALLVITVMISQLPSGLLQGRLTIGELLLVGLWVTGLWLIHLARQKMPWQETSKGEIQQIDQDTDQQQSGENEEDGKKIEQVIFSFAWSALITFAAGYALEESSSTLAHHFGLSGMFFGATFLAGATALPEVTTGLASIKMGEYELAISDIMGGNAFLPVLFPLGTLIAGQSLLSSANPADIYVSCLGILLTVIYMVGMIFRPTQQVMRMGIDSLVVLLLYCLGVVVLIFMPNQ